MSNKRIARIIEDVGGYYTNDVGQECTDTRGKAYPSRRAAIAGARMDYDGYTTLSGRVVYFRK